MTSSTWKSVVAAVGALENRPAWLTELARQNYEEVIRLPKLDYAVQGQTALPVIEEKIVAKDYLDFLREQVRLNARGSEWTNILQRRLDALQPFMGKMMITAHFYQKPHSVTLRVNPVTGELVNAEIF